MLLLLLDVNVLGLAWDGTSAATGYGFGCWRFFRTRWFIVEFNFLLEKKEKITLMD